MGSLVIWKTANRAILTSLIQVPNNLVYAEAILQRKGLETADYQWETIEGDYTTNDCKRLFYVDGESVTAKPEMGCTIDKLAVVADGVDFCTISGAPSGADILIDGVPVGTAGVSNIEITFDLSGQYVVTLQLFPYLDWQETISAT